MSRGHGIQSGDYVDAFDVEIEQTSRHRHKAIWHVQAPHYRLTHLLENGHACVNGGRTKAVEHIAAGKQAAEQLLDREVNQIF